MLNNVSLMGRLTTAPELKHTPNDVAVTTFSIAVDRDYSKGEKQTDFINIVAWRNTAEFICRNFGKGQLVALKGSIQTRSYTDKDGNKRTAFEVVADSVYFAGSKNKDEQPQENKDEQPQENKALDELEEAYNEIDDEDLPF